MGKTIDMAKVIEAAGGARALAEHLGLDRTTPHSWVRVPPHHARRVAALTGIPLHVLRPDLYEPPATSEAA